MVKKWINLYLAEEGRWQKNQPSYIHAYKFVENVSTSSSVGVAFRG